MLTIDLHCEVRQLYFKCAEAVLPADHRPGERANVPVRLRNGQQRPPHTEVRHGVGPEEAIETYLKGTTTWNPLNLRYEARTDRHTLYWAPHASGRVLVITCFRRGGNDGP